MTDPKASPAPEAVAWQVFHDGERIRAALGEG